MYIKLTNGKPENYSIPQLRSDNPQVSFPENPSKELLAEFFVFPLKITDRPEINYATQNVNEGVANLVGGTWTQTWVVTNASAEEIAQRFNDQSTSVRAQRNALLGKSDWTQMPDAGVSNKDEWLIYRQELRDVTKQSHFPWSVQWPVEPQ